MSLLEVDALEAGYDDALVLRGVSLNAAANEIVAVIGPNGAGKSTMLKAVYGLVTRRSGSVRFEGDDVTGLRADRLTRRGLNFVPQTENVFPTLTVAENLHVGSLVVPRAERKEAVARVHELFPILDERARQRAGTLSGGQRKLVELELDEHAVGDESGYEVGRVRWIDALERLAVRLHRTLPLAPVHEQQARPQHVGPARTELGRRRERAAQRLLRLRVRVAAAAR